MTKQKNIRKEKLSLRDTLSQKELSSKSSDIIHKITRLKEIVLSQNIFVYVSFRSEVITYELIEMFLSQKKTVFVPLTLPVDKRMVAVQISDIKKDLVPGYCGILEPKKELMEKFKDTSKKIDSVIVPGSVFDERGGRLGYGGGYYDKFLSAIPEVTRVGLAFELQIIKKISLQKHDEILDYTITEKRIITGRDKREDLGVL